jgi:hypothetical protein
VLRLMGIVIDLLRLTEGLLVAGGAVTRRGTEGMAHRCQETVQGTDEKSSGLQGDELCAFDLGSL